MRIISGTHKGRRLTAPKNLPVRPTTDMSKEALFNILNNHISFSEVSFLDLFAGTGNISYEFASRGCMQIMAVDSHFGCVKYINQTAEQLEFPINTLKADVFKYASMKGAAFDIIFADPPYDIKASELEELIDHLFENERVSEDGMVIIEHSKHTDLSKINRFDNSRKYGGSIFSFFK